MSPKHKHYICELDFVFHLADFCKSFFFTKVDCDIKLNKEIKSADAASAPADETALTAAGLMETTVVIIRVRKFGLVQLHLSWSPVHLQGKRRAGLWAPHTTFQDCQTTLQHHKMWWFQCFQTLHTPQTFLTSALKHILSVRIWGRPTVCHRINTKVNSEKLPVSRAQRENHMQTQNRLQEVKRARQQRRLDLPEEPSGKAFQPAYSFRLCRK